MALIQTTGNDPQGESHALPISGEVFSYKGSVPDGGTITTEWFETSGYDSLGFVFVCNRPGRYMLEYSNDQSSLFVPAITVLYDETGTRRKGAVDQDAKWARITWVNDSGNSANLSMRVNQKTGVFQPSLETLGAKGADTRLAQWSKSTLHVKDENGEYGDVNRTGGALNVNVVNSEEGGATDANQTNGNQRTMIVNGNNQILGSQAAPLNVALPGNQSVSVSNFPAPVTSVSVSNLPTTQQVSGAVSVTNFPAPVADQKVNGTVSVSNFPATQAVSGTLNIGNKPEVTVANFPAPVANQNVTVTNFPASQAISGAVTVSNFPSTQTVSGSVSISNLPNVQAISATALPLPSGASTAALQTAGNDLIGSRTDAAVTNTTASASLIAAVKGVTAQLQAGVATTGGAPVNLTIWKSPAAFFTFASLGSTYKIIGGYDLYSPNAALFLFIYNKVLTALPATGDTTHIDRIRIPQATTVVAESLNLGGFGTAISIAVSTTDVTFTPASSSQTVMGTIRGRVS